MVYKKTPAEQDGLALTPDTLRPVNSLTRASPKPGFLDYTTYLRLLIRDGHIKNSHPAFSAQAPAQPMNSSLQAVANNASTGTTDVRADQASWSQDDMPHVLYLLRPPPNWINEKYLKDPPAKIYQIHGQIFRDIPILPDYISPKLEGWRLQAWHCFDPRIKPRDILARMGNSVNGSTVQMRLLRFRADCPALGWANKSPKYDIEKTRIEGQMTQAGLDPASRTTRGLAWGLLDPNDDNSRRIEIASKKGWDSSVEDATAVHLHPISSATMPAIFDPAMPAPFAASTLDSQNHNPPPIEDDSDATISDGKANNAEEDVDELGLDTPLAPQTSSKRELSNPFASASKRQNTAGNVDRGFLPIWTPAGTIEGGPRLIAADQNQCVQSKDFAESRYPSPEEVPRAPSIAYPLQYEEWLANEAQNDVWLETGASAAWNDDPDIFPGVHYALEDSGIVRICIWHNDRWINLKTEKERQTLSDEECQLLAGFWPVGSEARLQQLEYLLDPVQAQLGFEDRNGQWGETNWDLNNTANIHYSVSYMEADALLARRIRYLEEEQVQYDPSAPLPFLPSF